MYVKTNELIYKSWMVTSLQQRFLLKIIQFSEKQLKTFYFNDLKPQVHPIHENFDAFGLLSVGGSC